MKVKDNRYEDRQVSFEGRKEGKGEREREGGKRGRQGRKEREGGKARQDQ